MVFFNHVAKQMAAKIVYYGPAFGGKTTNLQYIHAKTAENMRGEMVSLETESDRTIFFDLLPILYGDFQGYQTRFLLYTVPGQVYYNNTRKLVLQGADGIVFVADSQLMRENVDSLKNLQENLAEMDLEIKNIPLVLQYNKRDLKNIHSVADLQKALNPAKRPFFEATALYGPGVFETLKGLSNLTLEGLRGKLDSGNGKKAPVVPPRSPVREVRDIKEVVRQRPPEPPPPPAEKPKGTAPVAAPAVKPPSRPAPPAPVPAPVSVDFAHEPPGRSAKAQKTQVEYTKIALANPQDIDRELDRLRRASIQKPVTTGDTTQEIPAISIPRSQTRTAAAIDGPRVLIVPIATKDVGKVQSLKLHLIVEGEKLTTEYKKAFRVMAPKDVDGKRSEIGFTLDVRIKGS